MPMIFDTRVQFAFITIIVVIELARPRLSKFCFLRRPFWAAAHRPRPRHLPPPGPGGQGLGRPGARSGEGGARSAHARPSRRRRPLIRAPRSAAAGGVGAGLVPGTAGVRAAAALGVFRSPED